MSGEPLLSSSQRFGYNDKKNPDMLSTYKSVRNQVNCVMYVTFSNTLLHFNMCKKRTGDGCIFYVKEKMMSEFSLEECTQWKI